MPVLSAIGRCRTVKNGAGKQNSSLLHREIVSGLRLMNPFVTLSISIPPYRCTLCAYQSIEQTHGSSNSTGFSTAGRCMLRNGRGGQQRKECRSRFVTGG